VRIPRTVNLRLHDRRIATAGEGSTVSEKLGGASTRERAAPRKNPDSARGPRHAIRAWAEISTRIRAAGYHALLLDFDGTLAPLKRRPQEVRLSTRARHLLERLAARRNLYVAIISGRDLPGLRNVAGVRGVHYFGSHGAQREGNFTILSERGGNALLRARCAARERLAGLAGIWIEDKGLSVAIHYRGATEKTARAAGRVTRRILAPLRDSLHLMDGLKVWEILPRELPGKGATVSGLVERLPEGALTIYIGDDDTDEGAFAALPHEITVRVGRKKGTCANFYLDGPGDVLRFLSRFERELS
jgi:trehalose 6-phosphate phosphatase